MNSSLFELISTSTVDINALPNTNSLKSQIISYIFDQTIKALDHIILLALVYILVCLCIYYLIFRRLPFVGTRFIKNERFVSPKRVLIVTAHPDDECMFFGPIILSLNRKEQCSIYLLCLSNGNYDQKGCVRKKELWESAKALQIKSENVTIINASHLPDDPNVNWKIEPTAKLVLNAIETLDIDTIISFDREGISNHPNHCAIYYAIASLSVTGLIPQDCTIYTLDSVNICRKYSFIFDLIPTLLLSTNWFILNWKDIGIIRHAMRQHKSQLLWFRKLYIIFSRYMVINSLRKMTLADIELEMQINDS